MSAQTYRKKPVTVEAIQWTGENGEELTNWLGWRPGTHAPAFHTPSFNGPAEIWVEANEEWLNIQVGEWVLKDKLGFYPCKDEMFQHSYEPAP